MMDLGLCLMAQAMLLGDSGVNIDISRHIKQPAEKLANAGNQIISDSYYLLLGHEMAARLCL